MLNNEDIQKIIEAQQGIFPTRKEVDERFDELKQDFVDLQTSVDAYAKKADTYFQEMLMLSHKVDRHEKWLLQIAEKVGVKLEY